VDELAKKDQGRALVAKLNTDLAQEISLGFNIRGIPTTIVFKKGAELTRASGAMPLAALESLLQHGL
jgi:thioredoxin 2